MARCSWEGQDGYVDAARSRWGIVFTTLKRRGIHRVASFCLPCSHYVLWGIDVTAPTCFRHDCVGGLWWSKPLEIDIPSFQWVARWSDGMTRLTFQFYVLLNSLTNAHQFKSQVEMGGVCWVHDKMLPTQLGRMVPSDDGLNSASEWSGAMVSERSRSVQSYSCWCKGSVEGYNLQIWWAPNHTIVVLRYIHVKKTGRRLLGDTIRRFFYEVATPNWDDRRQIIPRVIIETVHNTPFPIRTRHYFR